MRTVINLGKALLLIGVICVAISGLISLSYLIESNFLDDWFWAFALGLVVSILFLAKKYWFGEGVALAATLLLVAGFIVGIVFTSNGPVRKKGLAAAVKGNLAGIRTSAELYFDIHNNTYGRVPTPLGACPLDLQEDQNLFFDTTIRNALKTITSLSNGAVPVCAFDAVKNRWAISSPLPYKKLNLVWYQSIWYWLVGRESPVAFDGFWCVDSNNASRLVPHHITEARCPEGR